jgi:TnpA family transposase
MIERRTQLFFYAILVQTKEPFFMSAVVFTHQELVQVAKLTASDQARIQECRHPHTCLGFAYQLAFVRLTNRFPTQEPFEVVDEVVAYVSVQLALPAAAIEVYAQQRRTIIHHQQDIGTYLHLRRFEESEITLLEGFLFEAACRLEQTGPLLVQAKAFLKENRILFPADDTLRRLIVRQRQQAREHIYARITTSLSHRLQEKLDALLVAGDNRLTTFQALKQPPGRPSPAAMLRLADKLERIRATEILVLDLTWLNNNYQRSLARYAHRCSADRVRDLTLEHRYAVLVCFLWQVYRDTIDYMVDMHDKLMTGVYNRAQEEMDEQTRKRQAVLQTSLRAYRAVSTILLDDTIAADAIRAMFFDQVSRAEVAHQLAEIETWLTGKYSHVLNLVVQRFSYLRQFAPALLQQLDFRLEEGAQSPILAAIHLLRDLNQENRRRLPDDAPVDFIPQRLRTLVEQNGEVDKHVWECVLLTTLRDELKAGNLFVEQSKRFGRFDDFFIADEQWSSLRTGFFQRAGLPVNAAAVPAYLTDRLNQAYDRFLALLPENTYASVNEAGWQLTADPSEKLDVAGEQRLAALKEWLSGQLREIKLPELLIEVDNDLHFTRHFMPPLPPDQREAEQVCLVLATLMAHGCNVGPYTMARLTQGITYRQIKEVTDWQLTEEAQQQALAQLVNAISHLDVTQTWGEGKTASSDGQRFRLKRQVLQRTYSHRFQDYALEFYSFIADNYAPFYSTVIECTDRDAAYVLDGLLYNESDLALEEHYTDTHGYTEINFAAFALLGRRFAPRIRGLHKQRIYRIDRTKNYGSLRPLVDRSDRTIHLDWIGEQWDRMGQFYASLESGHTTASTALKRLASYNGKNHFYRANRELGRVLKTEYILHFMSDPPTRQRVRRGLLKGEEMHALARQVAYGKQGALTTRELEGQRNTSNCLTLIMACIIYWQAKELNRVILEGDPEKAGIDLSLLEHTSPIGWHNIILYGEYVLNRSLVRT